MSQERVRDNIFMHSITIGDSNQYSSPEGESFVSSYTDAVGLDSVFYLFAANTSGSTEHHLLEGIRGANRISLHVFDLVANENYRIYLNKQQAASARADSNGYFAYYLSASSASDTVEIISERLVSVDEPRASEILSIFPNPSFNSESIDFVLNSGSSAELVIMDLFGNRVRQFSLSDGSAQYKHFSWDTRDESGCLAPQGVYLVKINTDGATLTRKLVLVR
jgi:hypothetical protein